MRSQQINELMGALAKAQGEMSGAAKDSANPFFKSKYADLNSIWTACREALSKNGLAVTQTTLEVEGGLYLETLLGHSSGQYVASRLPIRVKSDGKTNELQVLGSCLSYLRRYALAAIVGVAPADDDDGQSATGYQASKSTTQAVVPAARLVSPDQARDLEKILEGCDPNYVKGVFEYLKSQRIIGLYGVPLEWFPRMKEAAERKKDEWSKKMLEVEEDAYETASGK